MSSTQLETQKKLIATLDRIGFFQGSSVFVEDILESEVTPQFEQEIYKYLISSDQN